MRRYLIGAWTLAMLLAAASLGAQTSGASERVVLRYAAPPECPDDLQLVATIERFLAQSLSTARPQQLSIEARIHGDAAQGYSAKITFTSAQGAMERYLEHRDCSKLGEAVGLLAALAIDPERVRANQEANQAALTQPETEAPASPPPPVAIVEKPRTRPAPLPVDRTSQGASAGSGLQTLVSVSGQTVTGLLPETAPGLGAELALRLERFEVGLGARSWASRSVAVPNAADFGVAVSLTTVGLRACGVPEWKHWSLLGCARADWGRMSGSGEGVDANRARHAELFTLGASLALRLSIGHLEPFGGLEFVAPLARPRFGVLQNGNEIEAFKPDAWGWGLTLGLGYVL